VSTAHSTANVSKRTAVLEVNGSYLTFGLIDQVGDKTGVRWKHIAIENVTQSRHPQIARESILATLKEVVTEEKLQNIPLHIVLSGDFCVTRVVAGTREHVSTELNALRERSGLYLSLGHGAKTFAESVFGIDAKRAHGALTVANENTLTTLLQTAREAGFTVATLRHSLVALCRAVGMTGLDAESPVLIVQFNRNGIELGVSHRGRLLIDYRPGGAGENLQMAEVVLNHLGRIQRYCARNFSFTSGKISQVILCGAGEEVQKLRDFFSKTGQMKTDILDPRAICPQWQLDNAGKEESWLAPVLGAVVNAEQLDADAVAPDLMDPIRMLQRDPLKPLLIKYGWPLAAVAAVTLLVYMLGWWEQSRVNALQAQAEKAQEDAQSVNTQQLMLAKVDSKIRYWKTISEKVEQPRWHEFLGNLGDCLPEGTWLENVKVDREGTVFLSGPTYAENSVYELIEKLKHVPSLTNVALEGTRSARLQGGPVTLFDLKANYVGRNDSKKGS
jgi:Tfp pilus assembly protein PilN